MSAELNSKIGAQSGSMDANARGPEPMAGDESEVSITQALLEARPVFGSNVTESLGSVARLSFPSLDGATCSGSKARAVTGAISWVWPNNRSKSCSSR